MHKVCARNNFGFYWSYDVLQVEGIPETTKLKFLDTLFKGYELSKQTEGSIPI
jgi:hypothetical protein